MYLTTRELHTSTMIYHSKRVRFGWISIKIFEIPWHHPYQTTSYLAVKLYLEILKQRMHFFSNLDSNPLLQTSILDAILSLMGTIIQYWKSKNCKIYIKTLSCSPDVWFYVRIPKPVLNQSERVCKIQSKEISNIRKSGYLGHFLWKSWNHLESLGQKSITLRDTKYYNSFSI